MWYTLSQHFVFSSFIEDPDEAERAGLVFAGAVSSYRYGYMMSLASAVTIAAAVPLIVSWHSFIPIPECPCSEPHPDVSILSSRCLRRTAIFPQPAARG